jgi:ABC-type sugar transport system permease subunit/ABC-type glycerol-3-phosphate transport system substrate-binding protein
LRVWRSFAWKVAVAGLLLLAWGSLGRSGAAEPEKKIKLTIWNLPSRDAATPEAKSLWAIVQAFQDLHPQVDLRPFEGLQITGLSSMDIGPLMAMAGGTAPEVMYVNFRISETYISQNFLYPLDEYVEAWQKEVEAQGGDLSDIIPKPVWQAIRRKGPDGREHVWAIPYNVLVMALQWRKDLFKAAGVDPNHAPDNWDELYDIAMRVTRPEEKIYGIGLYTKTDAAWNFMNFLWSAGSEAVVQNEKGEWYAAYDDEGAVEAVDFYWTLRRGKWTKCPVDKEPVPFPRGRTEARCKKCGRVLKMSEVEKENRLYTGVVDESPDPYLNWNRGQVGMIFQYLTDQNIAQVQPNLIGLAPVPKGPTGKRGSELNCTMYGINSTIRDPATRDMTWEYIKFNASEEARRIRTKTFVESGFARYVAPRWLKKFGYEAYLREVQPGWQEVLDEAMREAKPEPYGKNCQHIYREMSIPLDKVIALQDPTKEDIRRILKREVALTNEKLLGLIPPEKKRQRNRWTLVFVVAMALAFGFLMRASLGHYARQVEGTVNPRGHKAKRYLYAWLILLPALLSVALWQYYPLLRGSLMAFQDYRLLGGSRWVGLENFANAFFNPEFWATLWRSAKFAGLMLAMGFLAPILLALMLHEVPRGKILYRTLYYLPAVTTGLVIAILWQQFYDKSPQGLLNRVITSVNPVIDWINLYLQAFGREIPRVHEQNWLGDPRTAMYAIILSLVWAGVGPGCIIYLAALRAIPEELYEAADLDGDSFWGKFRHITVPYLRPLIIINFVGAFIAAFRTFDSIIVMTGGGPANATQVLGLEIWFNAFVYLKYGYAVAMAWILGSLLIGFTVFQLRILSRLQFRTASA